MVSKERQPGGSWSPADVDESPSSAACWWQDSEEVGSTFSFLRSKLGILVPNIQGRRDERREYTNVPISTKLLDKCKYPPPSFSQNAVQRPTFSSLQHGRASVVSGEQGLSFVFMGLMSLRMISCPRTKKKICNCTNRERPF